MATPAGITPGFNIRQLEESYKEKKIKFVWLEFTDKVILQIYVDGEIDSSVDIQLPSVITQTYIESEEEEEELESKIKLSYIIGDSENLKILIMSSQVGKLLVKMNKNEKQRVILSLSSKIFDRRTAELSSADFDVLMFILESIKKMIS